MQLVRPRVIQERYFQFRGALDKGIHKKLRFMEGSFAQNIIYKPYELLWALAARKVVGGRFSKKLEQALKEAGLEFEIEERAKTLRSIFEKLTRESRGKGRKLPGIVGRALDYLGIKYPIFGMSGIRDLYGARVLVPGGFETDYNNCCEAFNVLLRVAGIEDIHQTTRFANYFLCTAPRYDEEGQYVGTYKALHLGIVYRGVPIEIQVRDTINDELAKTMFVRDTVPKDRNRD